MMSEMKCPNCNARIRSEDPFVEGTTMACPFCKTTFKLVAAGSAVGSARGAVGSGATSPPRAAAPAAGPAARKRADATTAVPAIQQSRSALAAVILLGVGGCVALFVVWYVGTVQSLTKSADKASNRRVQQVVNRLNNSTDTKKAPGIPPLALRPIAPATMELGDLVVGVSTAEVSRVKVNQQDSDKSYLVLMIRITNRSDAPVTYTGWQSSAAKVVLRDVQKNYYNRIKFSPGALPAGAVEEAKIAPAETISDLLVFEAPNAPYQSLDLDLPVTDDSAFRFTVPSTMIRSANLATAAVTQPQPPSTPAPGSRQVGGPPRAPSTPPAATTSPGQVAAAPVPNGKPTLVEEMARRRSITAEYRELWAQVERRAKGMSYDRGRLYKRTRRTEIMNTLAEKYKMTVDELRPILP